MTGEATGPDEPTGVRGATPGGRRAPSRRPVEPSPGRGGRHRHGRGTWIAGVVALLVVVIVGGVWAVGRGTAPSRRLAVVGAGDVHARAATSNDSVLTILAWNVAHGRGAAARGWRQNWRGGTPADRAARLDRMAEVLRDVDADVVVLNEVDFDAGWSGGVNQAALLARAAGYPARVEQRNFDVRLPFKKYAFGNAVLSRLPLAGARWLDLPTHSRLERLVAGAKAAALVRIETPAGIVGVVPVHLDPRAEGTRLRALSAFEEAREESDAPLVLAGDFNTSPAGWPGAGSETLVEALLGLGWRSGRADDGVAAAGLTYPADAPDRALDWILAEPPVRVVEARVVEGLNVDGGAGLSDHLPVVARLRVDSLAGPPPE